MFSFFSSILCLFAWTMLRIDPHEISLFDWIYWTTFWRCRNRFSERVLFFSIYRIFFLLCICLFLNSLSISSVSESNIEFMYEGKREMEGELLCDNWATSMESINCMENGGQNATISDSGHGRVLQTNEKKTQTQNILIWYI